MATDPKKDEDSLPEVPGITMGHFANRTLFACVCDLVVATTEHQRHLKDLAIAVRESTTPVKGNVVQSLVDEIRRDSRERNELASEMENLIGTTL
jgi:hypothetical protein